MSLIATAFITLTQAKAYLKIDQATSLHTDAEYVGMGDGETKAFSLDNTPVDGSLKLYVNGVLQAETTDFTISGTDITFVTAPTLNHPITASYDYAATADTFEQYEDSMLEQMINTATELTERVSQRAFITRSITESRVGNGDTLLRPFKQPIDKITTVTLDETELVSDTDFIELLPQGILRRDAGWTKDVIITLNYDAGDCANAAAVQSGYPSAVDACLIILSDLYEKRDEKIDSINISGFGSASYRLPSRAVKLLLGISTQGGIL